MDWVRIRNDRTLAHVVPLAALMVLAFLSTIITDTLFDDFFRNHPSEPWWKRYPEQWIYPVQTILCGVLLAFWWRQYEWEWSWWKVLAGGAMGAVGIGIWLLPTQAYEWMELEEEPTGWLKWLGVLPRRDGFDPGVFESPAAWWAATVLRFLRAAVVVAIIEEVFWRGFLMRFVLNRDGDYWQVPFGTPSWLSYLVVTACVVLIHSPADWAAAFVWGTLVYLLAVWTRSLLACVVMHGVANFLMGWYALVAGKFGLW